MTTQNDTACSPTTEEGSPVSPLPSNARPGSSSNPPAAAARPERLQPNPFADPIEPGPEPTEGFLWVGRIWTEEYAIGLAIAQEHARGQQ